MSKKIAPEAVLLTLLLAMLAGSLTLAYVKVDDRLAVWGARLICVLLTLLLVAGVIFPRVRALSRKKAERPIDDSEGEKT